MKTKFKAFKRPTEEEIIEILKEGLVIFDTNSLLNLYRYKEETRNKFFDLFEKIQARIWIPYHVGIEYHSNKKNVFNYRNDELKEIRTRFDGALNKLKNSTIKRGHREVDLEEFINQVESNLTEKLSEVEETFKVRNLNEEAMDVDQKIHNFFDNKVGEPFSETQLEQIYTEGKKRYENEIPPGYKDLESKEGEVKLYGNLAVKQAYGDLIIWKELLQKMSQEQTTSTLFITDDTKPDWYLESNQAELMARPELGQEFFSVTGKDQFAIINSEYLIKVAQKAYNLGISQADMENIKEAQKDFQETTGRLKKQDAEEAILANLERNDLVEFKRRDESFDAILNDVLFNKEISFDLKFIRKTYSENQFRDMILNNLDKCVDSGFKQNILCFAASQDYRYEEVYEKLGSVLDDIDLNTLKGTIIRLYYIVRSDDHYKVKSVKKILN